MRSETPRRLLGRRGEALAAAYLRRNDYVIIAANWRCAHGELDLVASRRRTLVFVEVRTRRSAHVGAAVESITRVKQERLARLAHVYLELAAAAGNPWPGPWRIDVVGVELPALGPARIVHLVSAIENLES